MPLDAARLVTALDAKMSEKIGGDYTTEISDAMKAGLLAAIAEAVIEEITAYGAVAFVAGDFSGDDSAGDTPDNLTATAGTIT